ncbi:unnamed protein product [Bursaphelenchus okinawaensis]|uniref:BPTI/Kunitz inhibitor domain-containing protein n=1 Tax=Bursaphelenchus okinawaensis TaxID=465554 RepID=A0A811L523_9BILA|nr:unnamed protein product [Bursaphelenchus okinawaensis]CAG9116859.1 unnamed protein product [Bursaphelenchus okinawaensis]
MIVEVIFIFLISHVFCSEDYKNQCNLTITPNLSTKLEQCEGNKCKEGFECNKDICCPTKALICAQPMESGKEVVDYIHTGRFGYDPRLNNCIKFSYFGSEGNYNNFEKFQDCRALCA